MQETRGKKEDKGKRIKEKGDQMVDTGERRQDAGCKRMAGGKTQGWGFPETGVGRTRLQAASDVGA